MTEAPTTVAESPTADPTKLVFRANVRTEDIEQDPDFPQLVASVRERGVETPISVYHDDDNGGALTVLRGHRRTLAAREAGRGQVPIHVVPRPTELDRLAGQLVENDHRKGISPGDRARAYQQMTLAGATPTKVAKLVARPRNEVKHALAVAGSAAATEAVDRHAHLTLEQAAVLAEFEGDETAQRKLLNAAEHRHGFDHTAQQLRDDRDRAAMKAEKLEELAEEGVTVVPAPVYGDGSIVRELYQLSPVDPNVDLEKARGLTEEEHADCPGGRTSWPSGSVRPTSAR
ncbi:ParB N-terminal domain-containing protein [Micromonospora sp. STR1s_5]|nr:ParB N-terminal domain-containing protein [Micromonospora sp. STR1s_5]